MKLKFKTSEIIKSLSTSILLLLNRLYREAGTIYTASEFSITYTLFIDFGLYNFTNQYNNSIEQL